jgi:hypothetical protein
VLLNPADNNSQCWRQQLATFMCPSFPGADESKENFANNTRMAVGNYVALSSTHFNLDGLGPNNGRDAGGVDNATGEVTLYDSRPSAAAWKQLAGNGCIPFWQPTSPAAATANATLFTQVRGVTQAAIQNGDGTSNTVWFTESREENWTGWISGYASFVVGADPNGPGGKVRMVNPDGTITNVAGVTKVLGWQNTDTTGQTALNIGSGVKKAGGMNATDPSPSTLSATDTKQAYFYMKPYPFRSDNTPRDQSRWYGPSSAHSGDVVLHGFADAHGKSLLASIDRNVYLWLISRAGREVVSESSGGGFN